MTYELTDIMNPGISPKSSGEFPFHMKEALQALNMAVDLEKIDQSQVDQWVIRLLKCENAGQALRAREGLMKEAGLEFSEKPRQFDDSGIDRGIFDSEPY